MSKLSRQIAAATSAANGVIAGGGQSFYTAICKGDGTKLWDGSFGTSPPVASTAAAVASVSKSLYAIVAGQLTTLGDTDYSWLTMTCGHDAFNGQQCLANGTQTVDQCLQTVGVGGIPYDSFNSLHNGKFAYDSAPWQHHADLILPAGVSLGGANRSTLASTYRSKLLLQNLTDLIFTQPLLAGGVTCPPTTLLTVCQNICSGAMNIKALLQDSRTPVNASMYFTDGSVIDSPAPADQAWTYKWGFWVEPGGQYYWMSGSFGTSVWIKSDFSMYGMVFRVSDATGGEMGVQSIFAGQQIRTAFQRGSNRFAGGGKFGLGWLPGVH